jgi:hypothetical protein
MDKLRKRPMDDRRTILYSKESYVTVYKSPIAGLLRPELLGPDHLKIHIFLPTRDR